MVMALNALGVPAPASPEYQPYAVFTQDNVLNEKTDAIRPREVLAHAGMTLDQLGQILSLYPVAVDVRHAAPGGADEFRKLARRSPRKNHFVIVNFLRKALGEQIGGHISPLGAYDEKSDRFLILDVARYKYPPVWVKTADLFEAMNTPDPDNDNKTRGYVLISGRRPRAMLRCSTYKCQLPFRGNRTRDPHAAPCSVEIRASSGALWRPVAHFSCGPRAVTAR